MVVHYRSIWYIKKTDRHSYMQAQKLQRHCVWSAWRCRRRFPSQIRLRWRRARRVLRRLTCRQLREDVWDRLGLQLLLAPRTAHRPTRQRLFGEAIDEACWCLMYESLLPWWTKGQPLHKDPEELAQFAFDATSHRRRRGPASVARENAQREMAETDLSNGSSSSPRT